jgi:hypothetical protein
MQALISSRQDSNTVTIVSTSTPPTVRILSSDENWNGTEPLTDEYSVQSRRGLCVKTGQLRVELIALKVV